MREITEYSGIGGEDSWRRCEKKRFHVALPCTSDFDAFTVLEKRAAMPLQPPAIIISNPARMSRVWRRRRRSPGPGRQSPSDYYRRRF